MRATRDIGLREGFIAGTGLRLAEPLVAPYLGVGSDGPSDRDADARPVERTDRLGATRARTGHRSRDARPRHRGGRRAPRDALGRLPPDQSGLGLAVVSAARAPAPADAAVGRALPRRGPGRRRPVPGRLGRVRAARARWRPSASSATSRHDPSPLLAALGRLPATGIHGDLKLANVALLDDGRVALIDWSMMSSPRSRSSSAGCSSRTRRRCRSSPRRCSPAIATRRDVSPRTGLRLGPRWADADPAGRAAD